MEEHRLQERFVGDQERNRESSPRVQQLEALLPDYAKKKGVTIKSLYDEYRKPNALPEEIDYITPRNLDRNQMERILSLDFLKIGRDVFITGSSGTGKSFLATAIGYEACKKGFRTMYANSAKLRGVVEVSPFVLNNMPTTNG